ncbi:MAG: Gldg family protein, partial [Anaerolineae bacterium]|nr:Gldg family protein [Anaerolineae bacterium]
AQLLFPSGDFSEATVRTSIESALKRSTSGFLQVVGVWTPPDTPTQDAFGQQQPSLKRYNTIAEQLRQEYTVRNVDLSTGQVPTDIDVLMVIAPQNMTDQERYAIDQYLMRGGSLIVAAGNYALGVDQFAGNLTVEPIDSGLREMLQGYGIDVEQSLVLDPQNEPFPIQVARDIGGMQVREIQAIDYPFFVDIRSDGMDQTSPILSSLPAVTLNFASPITVDEEQNAERQVDTLLQSSAGSWLRTDTNIQPDTQTYPQYGFPVEGEQQSYPLAVSVQGVFDSYFKDKEIPQAAPAEGSPEPPPTQIGTIDSSPDSARLVVIGSAEYLNDVIFELSSSLSRDRYFNSLQFTQNMVDWSVEDLDLLSIRSGGTSARVLAPMDEANQSFWEYINYGLALAALVAIAVIWRSRRRSEVPMELLPQSSQPTSSDEQKKVAGTV